MYGNKPLIVVAKRYIKYHYEIERETRMTPPKMTIHDKKMGVFETYFPFIMCFMNVDKTSII